jgi:hypothetical protein
MGAEGDNELYESTAIPKSNETFGAKGGVRERNGAARIRLWDL